MNIVAVKKGGFVMKKGIMRISILLMTLGLTACGTKTTSKEESSTNNEETTIAR